MTTWCSECEFVHPDTLKDRPWNWACMKAPTKPGFGFVSPDYSPTPPYRPCKYVNQIGECPMWEPRRIAPEALEKAPVSSAHHK